MYQVSNDYRTRIRDGHTRQDFLLCFLSGNIRAFDGDIESESGVTFSDPFNTTEDITLGETPSKSVSLNLVNDAGRFSDWEWGEASAWIGVALSETATSAVDSAFSFDPDTHLATEVRDGISYSWEYCPLGVYIFDRPSKVQTDVVHIDGHDRMTMFDIDCTEFTGTYDSAWGLDLYFEKLCQYVGVSFVPIATGESISTVPTYPNGSTCRTILGHIAERVGGVAISNRDGEIEIRHVGSSSVATFTADDLAQGGLDLAEYTVPQITGVTVMTAGGELISSGTEGSTYTSVGNSLLNEDSVVSSLFAEVSSISPYIPVIFKAIDGDPSIESGDIITLALSGAGELNLTDAINNLLTDASGDYLSVYATGQNASPLTQQTIVWRGFCSVTYESLGNAVRATPDDISLAGYNAFVGASSIASELDPTIEGSMASRIAQNSNGITLEAARAATEEERLSSENQALEGRVGALEVTADAVETRFTEVISDMEDVADAAAAEAIERNVTTIIRQTSDGIEISKSDSDFSVVITNTEIQFRQGSESVAYLSNSQLYITSARILDNMNLGGWKISTNDGCFNLDWVGVES